MSFHPGIKLGANVSSTPTLRRARAEVDLIDRWSTMAAWERRNYWPALTERERGVLVDTYGSKGARGA